MKIINWIVIIASILIVAGILFSLERWAGEWKNLFFYQDNWIMLLFLIIMVFAISGIIKWFLKAEVKILK